MVVTSTAITEGAQGLAYGAKGRQKQGGMPSRSFPLEIIGPPQGTLSFALLFDDPDSTPLCGFAWVHWLAANIHSTTLAEDASCVAGTPFLQGKTSWGRACYGGPAPPDKPHRYVLTVWALDGDLPLKQGFTKEQLLKAIEGHVLASAVLKATYPS